MILVALAVFWLGAGCGGGSDADTSDASTADRQATCVLPAGDARIDLHNSRISCQEAVAISLVLAGGVEGPQVVREWTCRTHPKRASQPQTRCRDGARYFTVVKAD